jgi:hypothetical protein
MYIYLKHIDIYIDADEEKKRENVWERRKNRIDCQS